jgi:hypothetical protein
VLVPPALRVPRLVSPPAILYGAHAYMNTRKHNWYGMVDDDHECLHMDEQVYLRLTE